MIEVTTTISKTAPIAQHIEALIFATEHPITLKEIQSCLEQSFETTFTTTEIQEIIDKLIHNYHSNQHVFEIIEIAEGYQFFTKPPFHNTVGTYLKQTTKKKLSQAALETLSIVAYKQPVSKTELEIIRGVNCDYAIQKLLEKELVTIAGRSNAPGRPLLYATSEKFMDYFGIKSLKDLPKPKDFNTAEQQIGETKA